MAIRFTCPVGHRLKVPDEKAGRGMLCPVCEESVTVPDTADADSEVVDLVSPSIEESDASSADGPSPENDTPPVSTPASVPPPLKQRATAKPTSRAAARTLPGNSNAWGVAAGALIAIAYSTLPALGHLRDAPMPAWVRAVFGLALLQAVFVVWMLTVRHWAAMVVVALSFALASTAYAVFVWYALAAGSDQLSPQGMASRAAVWSTTVLAVYLLATYVCGAAAVSWRRKALDEISG